jgi:hypothetical protein
VRTTGLRGDHGARDRRLVALAPAAPLAQGGSNRGDGARDGDAERREMGKRKLPTAPVCEEMACMLRLPSRRSDGGGWWATQVATIVGRAQRPGRAVEAASTRPVGVAVGMR